MKKALFISLIIHALFVLLFWVLKIPTKWADREVELAWESAKSQPVEARSAARAAAFQETKPQLPSLHTETLPQNSVVIEQPPADTLSLDNPDSLSIPSQLFYANFFMQKQLLEKSPTDSSARALMPMNPGLSFDHRPPMTGSNDGDIGTRTMAQRNQPFAKPIPLTAMAQALAQKLKAKTPSRPLTLRFIPSQAELDVLDAVWTRASITDQEVYATMDTSVRLTAVDVNRILHGLEEKGVLTSELVSPRHEFTFGTPVGGGGIELSAQNRRNRIYRYKSLVDRKHMIRYLQACLDQAKNKKGAFYHSPEDSGRTVALLQEKLIKLVR